MSKFTHPESGKNTVIINSISNYGEKTSSNQSHSEFYNPHLIYLNTGDDADYCVGRMRVDLDHNDERGVIPLEFRFIIELNYDEDATGQSWELLADEIPQISLGEGFSVGEKLEDNVAEELNKQYCIGDALRCHPDFIGKVHERLIALGKITK